ncbi:Low molecular weight protein-tyrosine-phosphatase etp [Corynebacterium kalinowskii]|uniref:Low molecular weight protein-tyrosine-phosphatase etp n=1 Tax=Corynebacterium kalinowskii TaxID=2675216 RepID=A0A6B8VZN8_9CORY|nr:low molecular weight phosphatase family protein [Corynebacterium kalinowskii]QGU01018.1 Low molecular weight protein-tyrosine-phosphatase etp [Corynebacterium kalinowskii]
MPETFNILTVCTGNICRSPLAEQLLRQKLESVAEVQVASAGIQAMVGHPMPEESLRLAKENAIADPEAHSARQLTEEMVEHSDLVLAMDRSHRKSIVELSPRSAKKTFTVRDLARLIEVTTDLDLENELQTSGGDTRERLIAALEAARLGRSDLTPLADPSSEDIIDPFQRDKATYHKSAAQLIPAIETISNYLLKALVV